MFYIQEFNSQFEIKKKYDFIILTFLTKEFAVRIVKLSIY